MKLHGCEELNLLSMISQESYSGVLAKWEKSNPYNVLLSDEIDDIFMGS